MTSAATRGPQPRILVLKLAALGDIVMASTLVGAIRRRWPCAHLTWIVGDAHAPLVRRFDGVDVVLAVPADALLAGGAVERVVAGVRTLGRIGRGPWDLALVAHGDERYETLLRGAQVKELRALRGDFAPTRDVWFGAEYARMVASGDAGAAGGAPADAEARSPHPPLATLTWPNGAPPRRARARRVLLAPGGARNVLRDDHLRRWPAERWAELAQQLVSQGCQLTLIGGAGDRAEADAVVRAVALASESSGAASPPASVDDRVGSSSLDATIELLASADVLVSHDSGPLHLAALTRTPAVALFGPTDPRQFVAPGADVQVMSAAAGLPCAPCYDGKGYAVCALNRCLTEVSVSRVAGAVLDRLQRGVGAEGLEPPTSAV